ncbi:acyloxyacyl hydrolase [Cupriavidus sp. AU9028]|uniref:acyloxyacyl hydrolase n=1 Tax=Cupriavidus sp. AU9028 TaxID=2871157 RepID=UPI001C949306|nr:acyloxyacyl hydrolase [Cupriavidus sp. AU9028]MBY4896616.1 acyloxyacyl hydrolase [Cupriavidus sp. AU9028]
MTQQQYVAAPRSAGKLRAASAAVAALAALTMAPAHADPGLHFAYARDTGEGINKAELGLNWDTPYKWGNPQGWQLKVQGEVNVAHWDARRGTNQRDVWELGLSPILRLEKRGGSVVPFAEASVGVRLLSHTSTSDEHRFSTAFQFSDMVGLGVAFGPQQRIEAGVRYQHISNASIKRPNPGTDFLTGYVRYRF